MASKPTKKPAKGSEKFSWKLWGTPPEARVCVACGRTLRVKDVVEHRTYYTYTNGIGVASEPCFWCHECQRVRLRATERPTSLGVEAA